MVATAPGSDPATGGGDPDIASRLPLTPRDFLILFSLDERPCHGYGILKRVGRESDGVVEMDRANLYRALKRLAREGLLEEASDLDRERSSGGGRRRYYALTALGRQVVAAEATRLAGLVDQARHRGLVRG